MDHSQLPLAPDRLRSVKGAELAENVQPFSENGKCLKVSTVQHPQAKDNVHVNDRI